jgi:hypothetical protein
MSGWNHLICDDCWASREGDREPCRVRGEAEADGAEAPPAPACCFCGDPTTSGIFVRFDPRAMPCAHRRMLGLAEDRELTGGQIEVLQVALGQIPPPFRHITTRIFLSCYVGNGGVLPEPGGVVAARLLVYEIASVVVMLAATKDGDHAFAHEIQGRLDSGRIGWIRSGMVGAAAAAGVDVAPALAGLATGRFAGSPEERDVFARELARVLVRDGGGVEGELTEN